VPAPALRLFNVYGPRQLPSDAYAAVIPAFVSRALDGKPLRVTGDGLQTREFVCVDTVADVVARAVLDRVCRPTPVNVAFGRSTSLLELVEALQEVLGKPLPVMHGPEREGDIRRSRGDGTLLRQLFTAVRSRDLAEGLADTVGWYRVHLDGQVSTRSPA